MFVAFIFVDPPGWCVWWLTHTSLRPPFDSYIFPSPSIFGRRLRFAPLSAKNRCGLRVDRVTAFPLTSLPVLATGFVLSGSFRAFVNYRLSIRGSQGHHTIFDGYVLAFRRHHSFVVVLARSTPQSTRDPRLPFRLVRTGIRTPAFGRRKPPYATILPPIRGLMNARSLARGTRSFIAEGRM